MNSLSRLERAGVRAAESAIKAARNSPLDAETVLNNSYTEDAMGNRTAATVNGKTHNCSGNKLNQYTSWTLTPQRGQSRLTR